MRFDSRVIRVALQPAWVALIIGATLLAALGGLWAGLQQDTGETSTSFVYARRVGFLGRPLPDLDDHLNEIINSVEFPEVFIRIEERLLLEADRDYTLEIGVVENTQSLVQIVVDTDRSGEADRISRIIAEEMVSFVLDGQGVSIDNAIDDLDAQVTRLEGEQVRLTALADGVPPPQLVRRFEAELAGFATGQLDDPVTNFEAALRNQINTLSPLADEYGQNELSIRNLRRERAQAGVDRLDINSGRQSINDEWYRAITPPEPTSNVPLAVAMAFAAAVPALIIATGLVLLNVGRRLARADRLAQPARPDTDQEPTPAAVSA